MAGVSPRQTAPLAYRADSELVKRLCGDESDRVPNETLVLPGYGSVVSTQKTTGPSPAGPGISRVGWCEALKGSGGQAEMMWTSTGWKTGTSRDHQCESPYPTRARPKQLVSCNPKTRLRIA